MCVLVRLLMIKFLKLLENCLVPLPLLLTISLSLCPSLQQMSPVAVGELGTSLRRRFRGRPIAVSGGLSNENFIKHPSLEQSGTKSED